MSEESVARTSTASVTHRLSYCSRTGPVMADTAAHSPRTGEHEGIVAALEALVSNTAKGKHHGDGERSTLS